MAMNHFIKAKRKILKLILSNYRYVTFYFGRIKKDTLSHKLGSGSILFSTIAA